jgi:hypothetical protein
VATKNDLQDWVLDAVVAHGGKAKPIDVARHVWNHHNDELQASGDLFFTWQYDLRWAAQKLRDAGKLRAKHGERSGTWDLS